MKILVTSSTGMTGRAVVKALNDTGAFVRAMIHSDRHNSEMVSIGASETVVASIENEADIKKAMEGMDAVFYICPMAHPEEGKIGCMAADIAEHAGIKRFVYQSIYNSIEPELPHHRQKLMVEQHLLESDLNYSILRPAAFMQNILLSALTIRERNIFGQRFFTSIDSTNRISLIDVDDYATIAAKIATGEGFDYGCFDLCGPDNLSAVDMLTAISDARRTPIALKYTTDEEFIAMAKTHKMPENTLNTLLAMFHAYNQFGFKGNSLVSETLLGHTLKKFKTFVAEQLSDGQALII